MKVRGIPLPLSKSCREINPQLEKKGVMIVPAQTVKNVFTIEVPRSRTRIGLRCGMNKTEREYTMILEGKKRYGEILRYEFEGITLRFANVKYTPDFVVVLSNWNYEGQRGKLKFIEVKGPFIKGNRERAVERFRHAKTYWPEFAFEMWQKKDGGWSQII